MTGNLLQVPQRLGGRAEIPDHAAAALWGFLRIVTTDLWLSHLLCFAFLVHHSLVEFYLQEPRNKDTSIAVTFLSGNVTSSVKIDHGGHSALGAWRNRESLRNQALWRCDSLLLFLAGAQGPQLTSDQTVSLPHPGPACPGPRKLLPSILISS